ncbi:MAG: methyl-accepting chemotaxis protein [Methanolinea sp.]|nr:methyl-accepting chemotaxis protein [Methanolinea sp.]
MTGMAGNTLADIREALRKGISLNGFRIDPGKVDPACREFAETINELLRVAADLRTRNQITFNENPFPILIFDRDWTIIAANESYSKLSGIEQKKLRGMSVKNFKVLDQKGEGLKVAITERKRSYGVVTVEMPSGVKILEQYGIPILDERGEVKTVFALYNDITEKRKLEDRLAGSMREIGETLSRLANGDLTMKVVVHENDPLASVKDDLNATIDRLNALVSNLARTIEYLDGAVGDILTGTDEIARASQNVALTAQKNSEDAKNQLSQLEKVTRQIVALNEDVERIARTTHQMAETSRNVLHAGDNAGRLGKEASLKMNLVQDLSQRVMDEMVALNAKTQEISKIVRMITDIANQTNLLALNAAIEAARAGEHGRGFAVVAEEVRNLAGGSKNATKSIDTVIRDISHSSSQTVDSMRKAYEEIMTGIKSVEVTIQALNQMSEGIRTTAEAINQISKATENQAAASENLMHDIELIHNIVVANEKNTENLAALAEESSASIEEIASATSEIRQKMAEARRIVESFKVRT